MHDTSNRPALFHQRDIDGKLSVAREKLLGAVQRIHKPEGSVPDNIWKITCRGRLFRDDRYVGRQLPERVQDKGLAGLVGSRDR